MEHPKGKSMTIPDESYTIQQLMERMMAGIPAQVNQPYDIDDDDEAVHDDEDLEQFGRLDITEKEEILQEAEEVVKVKRKHETKKEEERKKKEEEERLEKAYQERKKKEDEDNAKKSVSTQH